MGRAIRSLLPIGLILHLVACSSPDAGFEISITGAVNRDLTGARAYYEGTPSGRQLYIEKQGPGEDIQVLTIEFPSNFEPGTYTIGSTGFISGVYFEFVGGVSSQFRRNVNGSATFSELGGEFSGQVDFIASAPFSEDTIRVVGTFADIPYHSGVASGSTVSGAAIIGGLVLLLAVNLLLQFIVGAKVYASEGGGMLKSLRGTRTFIRGWQIPEIRSIMLIWSLLLLLLILILGFLAVMAASINA